METLRDINLDIAKKLKKNASYRKAFFRASVTENIAETIKSLRDLRNHMTQAQLAELCSMKQSAISRIEHSEYSAWTFNTLMRVAEALEARLIVSFQPAEDAINEFESFELTDTGNNQSTPINFTHVESNSGSCFKADHQPVVRANHVNTTHEYAESIPV